MDLSLRGLVRDHYSITGSFSVINDILSRAKSDIGEQTYRTADGSVSLRLLLRAIERALPPLDLIWDAVDDNGIPKNPKWRYQIITGSIPDPRQVCPTLANTGTVQLLPTCTSQEPSSDSAWKCDTFGGDTFGFHGHLNWFGATIEGLIRWENKSAYVLDDDYNFQLFPVDGAGSTTTSNGSIGLEFDARETIDHFYTPWWDSFHKAVDQSNAAALQMVNGPYAIVTGLFGLDCAHSGSAELHPVWAMAIRVKYDLSDQLWAIFVRNWGNEGFCSSHQHHLPIPSFKFRLPWISGATSVNVLGSTQFLRTDPGPEWVGFECAPNEGVLVTFTLPPPEARGRINGELHLQWQFPSGAQKPLEPPLVSHGPVTREDQMNTPEEKFAALLAQMTPTQRETLIAQYPKEDFSKDALVQPQITAVQVPHLPATVVTSQPLRVQSVVDNQMMKINQIEIEAFRAAFGEHIPGLS